MLQKRSEDMNNSMELHTTQLRCPSWPGQ